MEHIALYRKYRPKKFSEIMGQDNIIKILTNQISSGSISHAYLFSGTRGTGKTSAAKIFAKAVNCLSKEGGEPCNKCEICRNIESNDVMDIIEIDAASNRGVDEMRELRDKVKYPPTLGNYKVYIIDEVHMLTTEAFNALLKTLEEPPKHVVFILATTEPNKLPTTILSRCQRFNFRRIQLSDIVDRMAYICDELNIKIEDKTLKLIGRNADGALRDALSILDQCLSLKDDDNVIEYESVKELMGIGGDGLVYHLAEAVITKDVKSSLELLDEAYRSGVELNQLIRQMITCFRDIIVCKVSGSTESIMETSEENRTKIAQLSKIADETLTTYCIEQLSEMENKIKYSTVPKVLMEVALIKLSSTDVNRKNLENDKIKSIEIEHIKENTKPVQEPRKKDDEIAVKEAEPKYCEESNDNKFDYEKLCKAIAKESPLLGSCLQMGKCTGIEGNDVKIMYDEQDSLHYSKASEKKAFIEEHIKKTFGVDYKVNICKDKNCEEKFIELTKKVFGEDKVYIKRED